MVCSYGTRKFFLQKGKVIHIKSKASTSIATRMPAGNASFFTQRLSKGPGLTSMGHFTSTWRRHRSFMRDLGHSAGPSTSQ